MSVIIALGISVLALAITVAQETLIDWRNIGHSLVLWILIGVVVANLGSYGQAKWSTPAAISLSVAIYYAVLVIFGRTVTESFILLILFWLVAAIVGGRLLAYFCDLALRADSVMSWTARGLVAGMICGSGLNSAMVGIPSNWGVWKSAVEAFRTLPQPLVLGIIGSVTYLVVVIFWRQLRVGWRATITPVGVIVGWLAVSMPDILADVLRYG